MVWGGRGNAQRGGTSSACIGGGSAHGRAARSVRLRVAIAAWTLALLAAIAAGTPAAAAPGDTLGVYPGSGNTAGAVSFGNRLGRSLTFGHDFLSRASWAAMNDSAWLAQRWADLEYSGHRLILTVPMIPDTGGSLAAGAAGDYNEHFRTLAETLVANHQGASILRIGPEFNGTWYRWTINQPRGGALYAAYWRQIVSTMRAVAGADFKFDWCANDGSSWVDGQHLDAESAYPGDAWVDYIGLDVYDQSWAPWKGDPVARWNEYLDRRNGMRWHASFAAARGKPMTFPEWGLADRIDGNGGGDSPYFVEQMYWWIKAHNVGYHLYFESGDPNGQYGVFSGRFPNAAQRFVDYFGPNGPEGPSPPPPPLGAGGTPGGGSGSSGAETATEPATPHVAPGGGGARHAVATAGGSGARNGRSAEAAKLSIARAQVMRRQRAFDLLAPITRRASGLAKISLHAGGQRSFFYAGINGARGHIKVRKRVSRAQARRGTGIVTIEYLGDSDTQPSAVRLRAARNKARLKAERPVIEGQRLRTRGTLSRRAHGVVRVQLVYTVGSERIVRQLEAPIRNGRWRLDTVLSPSTMAQISRREGALHSYTLFTGYLVARMRGEMRSAQVLPAR